MGSERCWKSSHGGHGKSWKSHGFFVRKRVGALLIVVVVVVLIVVVATVVVIIVNNVACRRSRS